MLWCGCASEYTYTRVYKNNLFIISTHSRIATNRLCAEPDVHMESVENICAFTFYSRSRSVVAFNFAF